MGTKKIVLMGIWLAMLAGVIVWVNVMTHDIDPIKVPPAPIRMPDGKTLAARWPEVVAHAVAPPRGRPNTAYTIAEFGDFQCPQCGAGRPLLEKLLAQYPAQVNLIFLHRPFSTIHEWALPSAQAGQIAADHGKFWPMYDVLYAHQTKLATTFYGDYAAQAGLNKAQFQAAFDKGVGQDQVSEATQFADSLGITRTPWLLVRDNAAKTLTIYIGLTAKGNAKAGIPYPGIEDFVQKPPWVK